MKPAGKKETLLKFLERGIAMLHLDARRPGVSVPAQHEGDPHLRINLSYRYGIPDLLIDDEHVQATLSFGSRPFQCQLPWSAVFGVTSQTTGDGQVWPEDLPTEVMSTLAAQEQRIGAEKISSPGKKRGRPALVAVESAPEEAGEEAEAEKAPAKLEPAPEAKSASKRDDPSDPPPENTPRKGHLRLIR